MARPVLFRATSIWLRNIPNTGRAAHSAVISRSVDGSDVIAHYDPNFTKPTKLDLAGLAAGAKGFRGLPTGPGGKGLDYLRDDLFPISAMAPIPPDGQGVTLSNLLDGQVERAKADQSAVVIAFGEFFQDPGRDQTFGFAPELGCARHPHNARQQRQFRRRQSHQW